MKKFVVVVVLSFFFVSQWVSIAQAAEVVRFSPSAPLQGDAVVATVLDKSRVPQSGTFDGEPVAVFRYRDLYRLVFPVSATKPAGSYPLVITFSDGGTLTETVKVKTRKFQKITLGIPEKLGLTPQTLVKKLETEKVSINEIANKRTAEIFFTAPFGLPLYDNRKVSSLFGEIRKTGDTEIRHLGVDFGASRGAHVGAMNAGIVRKAYMDTVYGNSVILDHGQGIFSLYLHLDEMRVKDGDQVKKGTVVGTVGTSGYATEPHLHLSLKVGGVSIDPIRFVANFK